MYINIGIHAAILLLMYTTAAASALFEPCCSARFY